MPASFGGQDCIDVGKAIVESQRIGIQTDPWGRLCNGYKCSLGVKYGEGDILLTRDQIKVLARQRNDLLINEPYDLIISVHDEQVTIKELFVVAAVSCHPSADDDPWALYHLRLADKRYVMRRHPLDKKYNLRLTPTGPYVESTQNTAGYGSYGGYTPWTWTAMFQDIWSHLPENYAGPCPDVSAYFPEDFYPEGFDFAGWYALDAIGYVLDRLALALVYNPQTGVFSVCRPGESQPDVANAVNKYFQGHRLIDDASPIEPTPGRLPEKVRVSFPIQPTQAYGMPQWYSIDVPDPDPDGFAVDGSIEYIRDDLPAMYQGLNTLTNGSDLAERATLRAVEWYQERRLGVTRLQKLFSGALPEFVPGGLTRSVQWRDAGTLSRRGPYEGVTTEIMRFGPAGSTEWQGNREQPYNLTEVVEVVDPTPNEDGYVDCIVKLWDSTSKQFVTAFPAWGKEANS